MGGQRVEVRTIISSVSQVPGAVCHTSQLSSHPIFAKNSMRRPCGHSHASEATLVVLSSTAVKRVHHENQEERVSRRKQPSAIQDVKRL